MNAERSNGGLLGPATVLVFIFALDWRFRVGGGASFTLFEIAAWIIGPLTLAFEPRAVKAALAKHWGILGWVTWVLIAGLVGIGLQDRSSIAPLMKNTLPAIWLFVALAGSVRSPSGVIWVLRALFIGVALNCALGLIQASTGQGYIIQPGEIVMQKLAFDGARAATTAMGTFSHPNNFGLFISPIISLALALLITRPAFAVRCFVPVFLLLAVPALYFSYMKSGFLWVGIGAAVAVAPRFFRKPWFIIPAIALAGLAMFGFGVQAAGGNRLFATLVTRSELWSNAFAMISDSSASLIFGSDPLATAYRAKQVMGWLFTHAHNGWINQVLFFGVPAGAFFAVAWFQAVSRASAPTRLPNIGPALTSMLVTFGGMLILENVSTTNLIAMIGLISGVAYAAIPQAARLRPASVQRAVAGRIPSTNAA